MEDLSLLRSGHRNVAEEVVTAAWATIDTDRSGEIDPDEFRAWLPEHALVAYSCSRDSPQGVQLQAMTPC